MLSLKKKSSILALTAGPRPDPGRLRQRRRGHHRQHRHRRGVADPGRRDRHPVRRGDRGHPGPDVPGGPHRPAAHPRHGRRRHPRGCPHRLPDHRRQRHVLRPGLRRRPVRPGPDQPRRLRWAGPVDADDQTLLQRAAGPLLDVGCGPGRLTAALHASGTEVLGLELLPDVPVLARRAGAPLHSGDVFDAVPRSGQWRTVLLADGSVGIGGDAVRLLARVRALLAPGGRVLCELHVDGDAAGPVRLEGLGVTSSWFPWAFVGRAALPATAAAAGLRVEETWRSTGRSFAALVAA